MPGSVAGRYDLTGQVRERYGSVCVLDVGVHMIKSVFPSGRTLDMLVEFRQDRF